MKRFSITGWGGAAPTATTTTTTVSGRSSGEFAAADGHNSGATLNGSGSSKKLKTQADKIIQESSATPIQPQTTGGLWSSWWSSSGGEKTSTVSSRSGSISSLSAITSTATSSTTKTPVWYVNGIKSYRPTDSKMVKHLISLRVHLSTANLAWIGEFVNDQGGLDALGGVLAGLVGKGGKRKRLGDVEEMVLLEVTKCLRVLLNTEVRFTFYY